MMFPNNYPFRNSYNKSGIIIHSSLLLLESANVDMPFGVYL